MSSLILRTAARLLKPLLLVASVLILLRGHNQPGGGFVGGLLAAAAFTLQAIAVGVHRAREALHIEPRTIMVAGIATALTSGLIGVARGEPFLTGQWYQGGPFSLGTVLLFDLGVYLVVLGTVLLIIFTLAEER